MNVNSVALLLLVPWIFVGASVVRRDAQNSGPNFPATRIDFTTATSTTRRPNNKSDLKTSMGDLFSNVQKLIEGKESTKRF